MIIIIKIINLLKEYLYYNIEIYICYDNFLLPRIPDNYEYAKGTARAECYSYLAISREGWTLGLEYDRNSATMTAFLGAGRGEVQGSRPRPPAQSSLSLYGSVYYRYLLSLLQIHEISIAWHQRKDACRSLKEFVRW